MKTILYISGIIVIIIPALIGWRFIIPMPLIGAYLIFKAYINDIDSIFFKWSNFAIEKLVFKVTTIIDSILLVTIIVSIAYFGFGLILHFMAKN